MDKEIPLTDLDFSKERTSIRARYQPLCIVCGEHNKPLYSGLHDLLFNSVGEWSYCICSNDSCGLIWLDQMPIEQDIHLAYSEYYTHEHFVKSQGLIRTLLKKMKSGYLANHFAYKQGIGYAERILGLLPWLYPGRPAELSHSVMRLEAAQLGRLLDIGSGNGWLVEHMNQLGWQAEGLDFDIQSVKSARQRGLVFHEGDLFQQQFSDASFDAVTMSHCIEHFHDPLAWLIEVRRILKPGGRLSLVTPNTQSYGHQKFGRYWCSIDPPRHLHLFNLSSIKMLLHRAGFDDSKVFTSVRDANGYFIASSAIKKNGFFDMLASRSFLMKLHGRNMQLIEIFAKFFDRTAGEEIVVMTYR